VSAFDIVRAVSKRQLLKVSSIIEMPVSSHKTNYSQVQSLLTPAMPPAFRMAKLPELVLLPMIREAGQPIL